MDRISREVIEKATELARLDRECKEFSYEAPKPQSDEEFVGFLSQLIAICARAFELKNEVRLLLSELSNLNIHDPEIEKIVRDIRDDKKLYSITQYERLAYIFNKETDDFHEKWEIDAGDFILSRPDALGDFHGMVDYVSYLTGVMRVGTLVSRRKISKAGLASFREIRESFAFGLYLSSIALCRALLETAFFETLKRKGYVSPEQSKVVKIDIATESRLFRLIKDAFKMRLIDYDTKEDAFFVKDRSNTMVLHAKDEEHAITEDLAFEVIKKTVHVVEQLYEK